MSLRTVVGFILLAACGLARAQGNPAPSAPSPQASCASAPGTPACITDTDGDGVPDAIDRCPNTPPGYAVDAQGCIVDRLPPPSTIDTDGDGVPDAIDRCPNTPPGYAVDAQGCVIDQIKALGAVGFATNSARLNSSGLAIVAQAAEALKQTPGLLAHVVGHTDSKGTQARNLALSERRAESVRAALIADGVDAARVSAEGQGPFSPIASNDTEPGRALNRRVELRLRTAPAH